MDKIFLNHIECDTVIGTLPEERLASQKIVLDVELHLDLHKAAASDVLTDSADYSALERRCVEVAAASRFQLLEALAGAIGQAMLEEKMVQTAIVRIEKPGGARFGRSVSVELEFHR